LEILRKNIVRELHKKDELLAAALPYPILWDGHTMPAPQEILDISLIGSL